LHLPTPENIEVSVFKENAKKRIFKETVAIGKIYDHELALTGVSEAALYLVSLPEEASKYSYLSIPLIFF